ncbi:integrase core domain-containing protein [Salimicrobium flavidum]|uniref:Integrase core domain-containing protein n=1 Tax=Salimicrobium flavidum TaxID=570947 RepID=A0A1N7KT54_9BACI|nr:integrase core domain-containing protein [Salimicrobium flavidum]SIS64788.1 Integrase core domain-containing protein [Salimicrobium flavidum]
MKFLYPFIHYCKRWVFYLRKLFKIDLRSAVARRFEYLELQSQLAEYVHYHEKHDLPKPRPSQAFRHLWVALSKLHKDWTKHLGLVKPSTVRKWHRNLFKTLWKHKSRNVGRPPLQREWIKTIKEIHKENPLYSPERIHDQLKQLGIENVPAPNTIAKYLPETRKPTTDKQRDSWKAFIRNHLSETWAMDFLTIPTIKMDVLYIFVIIHHKTRKIIHFSVTKNPNQQWVKQQLREATPYNQKPTYLIHDNDPVFHSKEIQNFLEDAEITSKNTSYRSPWQNPYAERVNGTLRREVLDYLIPLNERHVEQKLYEYIHSYYNTHHTHQGLRRKTPMPTPTHLPVPVEKTKLKKTPVLGGLYHTYWRAS